MKIKCLHSGEEFIITSSVQLISIDHDGKTDLIIKTQDNRLCVIRTTENA